MSKTINQALSDLVIGLGGDPSVLTDNDTVSDYIEDLKDAIKECASGESEALIDDTEASETKTYSSSKIESLIPENELPVPQASQNGQIATIVKDGNTYKWGVVNQFAVYTGRVGNTNAFTLDDDSPRRTPVNRIPMILTAYLNTGEYLTFTGRHDSNSTVTVFTAVTRGTNSTTYHTITKTLDWSDTSLNGATYASVTINDPA